eukprot:scaffold25293_cov22-Tisochrysis_lutea.AAC.1
MVLDAINKVLVLGATVLGAINTSELGAIKALKQALTKPSVRPHASCMQPAHGGKTLPACSQTVLQTRDKRKCFGVGLDQRLRRGLVAPLRMRRVDEWGWVIPGVLGDERLPRFVEDQRQLIQLRGHMKLLKVSS